MIILYVNNVLKGMEFIHIGLDMLIVQDAGFKDVCSVRNLRKNASSVKLGSIYLQIQGVLNVTKIIVYNAQTLMIIVKFVILVFSTIMKVNVFVARNDAMAVTLFLKIKLLVLNVQNFMNKKENNVLINAVISISLICSAIKEKELNSMAVMMNVMFKPISTAQKQTKTKVFVHMQRKSIWLLSHSQKPKSTMSSLWL